MIEEPAVIARRLSPAQKRALLWLPEDGGWSVLRAGARGAPSGYMMRKLRSMSLAAPQVGNQRWRTTDHLGLRVRALLEQERAP